jgi:Hemerythrin HHE cation binding domain
MTEHKTMNTIIHTAFRRDLRRFDVALDTFPAGSQDRADELSAAWDNFAFQLHHHHQDEETIFWPVLSSLGIDDALTGDLEGEHAVMLGALDRASKAVEVFHADPSAANAKEARDVIGDLEAVLTSHLVHEEREMEPRAAEFHATPEIKAAQKRARRAHRGNQGTLFAWLLDGADDDVERGLRREVPRPVLFVISRVGGRGYRRTVAPIWA